MELNWSQAYSYVYIATAKEKPQSHLTEALRKIDKRIRTVEPISKQPHLGENLDTYT